MTKEDVIKTAEEVQTAINSFTINQPQQYTATINPTKLPITALKALDKIDHTLCLNINEGNLKFGLDKYDKIDCEDIYELLNCIDIVRRALINAQQPQYVPPTYYQYIPNITPSITPTIPDPCENCPCKGGLVDGLGNPILGDSPCDWCTNNKLKHFRPL